MFYSEQHASHPFTYQQKRCLAFVHIQALLSEDSYLSLYSGDLPTIVMADLRPSCGSIRAVRPDLLVTLAAVIASRAPVFINREGSISWFFC